MERSRVVEVYCEAGDRLGTGYLATGDTVLTAWHVVQAAGLFGIVEIRALARDGERSRWFRAAVVWPTPQASRSVVDVALLVLADSEWRSPPLAPVRWGRIVGDRPLAVTGLGFPDAARDPGGTGRDSLPLRGHIDPLAHAKSGDRHVLLGLDGPIVPARTDGPGSPWSGASGAALFFGDTDIVVAVVTLDHDLAVDARTLIAVPVTAWAADDEFVAVAGTHGLRVELVDVTGAVAGPPASGTLPAAAGVDVPFALSNVPLRAVFVGRVEELERLAAAMQDRAAVVTQTIAGLGGIGKSALAAEYAHRHAAGYIGTWWLTADSRANAEAGLATLARRLCPDTTAGPAELLDWAIAWLQGHPGWLLVWDNVDDTEDVSALIAALPGGHHLVTSRRSGGWHRIGVQVPLRLGELETDDAVRLLTALAGPGLDVGIAAELCAELGCLPLAVEQVGAYLAEAGISGAEYLALWRTAQARAVSKAPESHRADRIMTGVWRITLDRLVDTPLAGRLLRIMAWLAPDRIMRDLLTGAADDPDDLAEALRRLNAYSMIGLHPADGTVSVHRVVQAVTRTPDPADPHRRPEDVAAARNTAIDMISSLAPDGLFLPVDAAARWRLLLPHIDAFAGHSSGHPVTADTVTLMDHAYSFLRQAGNEAAGIRIAACLLAGELEHHGEGHPDTLNARNNLAFAYYSAGDLGRAIPLSEQTLTDLIRTLGPDHPHSLAARSGLAVTYSSAGDTARAIPLLEQTLIDSIRVLGPNHPDTLNSRNNLASAYSSAGHAARAIPLHEQTLTDRIRVLGPDHPDTLGSRNNLAYAYEAAGDAARAIPLHEQTLTDRVRVLGKDHPSTLASRSNLAVAYRSAGDLGRAIPLYEQTLADSIRVLGPDHPNTLTARNNVASVYVSAGDVARAIPLFEQTLADRVRVLSEDHPSTLASRNNLAYVYRSAGDVGRAIPLYEQTLADFIRTLGPDHPNTLTARNDLAYTYQSVGDLTRAIPLFQQNLADRIRILGEDHPNTLDSRNNLAYAYSLAGDLGRGIPLFEQTLTDLIRVLGEDHPRTLNARSNLADAYQLAGDTARAIPLLEQTVTDSVRVLGEDHPHTLTSRHHLASAYASAGGVARAIPLHEQTLTDSIRVLGPDHPDT